MAYLQTFRIRPDGKQIIVTVEPEPGSTLTNIKLWTQDNYRDNSNYTNLSSKLNGAVISRGMTFTIEPGDINISNFNGIYFIEIEDDSVTQLPCEGCDKRAIGVTTDFSRFYYCLVNYLCDIDPQCVGCDNELWKALTMKLYIDGLKNSLQLGKFTTAINFWKNLNRVCKTECEECCNLSGIAKKGLGFQTLGGELIIY